MDSSASHPDLDVGSVHVTDVHHRYGGPRSPEVLVDVSLHVEPGRIVALLGPSGCGKTTLLRSIAGLERPDSGRIEIDGREVAGPSTWVPAERRKVGMVFQDWALFPHLTVAGNVGYGLGRGRESGRSRKQRDPRVAESLGLVGLAGFEDRMPATLSGGQQQRVALARALAPRPQVLLLDEPFSNLDTGLRTEVRTEVHRLLLNLGITAVFVTHDQEEAFVLGDDVAVMQDGRIQQVGSPHELYTAPATRWVAEFVGDATMVEGRANGWSVTTPFGELALESPIEGEADVLFRPEQLSLVTDGGGRDEPIIDGNGRTEPAIDGNGRTEPAIVGSVELIEYYGHDAMVTVRLDRSAVRVRTGPDPAVRRNDRVGVAFTGSTVRAFAPGA